MSIFGSIMNKIFHHGSTASASPAPPPHVPAPAVAPAFVPTTTPGPAPAATTDAAATSPASLQQGVDVGAVLAEMASMKDGGGNYKTSIVDLLKLLDLDSSLAARKQLAEELNIHVGADGSADENIALHKAVMAKLAENGGVVPDALRGRHQRD